MLPLLKCHHWMAAQVLLGFILPDLWPLAHPVLNPGNSKIWGCLQRCSCNTHGMVVEVWSHVGQGTVVTKMEANTDLHYSHMLIMPYPSNSPFPGDSTHFLVTAKSQFQLTSSGLCRWSSSSCSCRHSRSCCWCWGW